MAAKIHTTTPLSTAAATSRVPYAVLETCLVKKSALEAVQKAVHANMRGGKKPTIAAISSALGVAIA